jgi:ribosomal protein L32E
MILQDAIGPIVAAISASGLTAWFSRRKTGAEANAIDAGAYKTLSEARHIHWDEMEKLLVHLTKEVSALQDRITAAEGKADLAIKGQKECEERERGLIERIVSLEATRTQTEGDMA